MRAFLALLLLAGCMKTPEVIAVSCGNPVTGCRLTESLELRFLQSPSVMQAFDLEVMSAGTNLHASFQMQGMEMGLNHYRLLREGNKWRAKVMLPACIQGRHDWLLRLEVDGTTYEVPFTTG